MIWKYFKLIYKRLLTIIKIDIHCWEMKYTNSMCLDSWNFAKFSDVGILSNFCEFWINLDEQEIFLIDYFFYSSIFTQVNQPHLDCTTIIEEEKKKWTREEREIRISTKKGKKKSCEFCRETSLLSNWNFIQFFSMQLHYKQW